jgi:hypothetical protein
MEAFSLTEIGEMIREEGIKEGIKIGMVDSLIKLLIKKFGKIPNGYEENIKKLSSETIEIIALGIFDMKDIKELEKYF